MESGREGVIPLDKDRMERVNVYFNDINLRIDLAKKINQLQSNWNSLKNWVFEHIDSVEFNSYDEVLDKMNELEGGEDEQKI